MGDAGRPGGADQPVARHQNPTGDRGDAGHAHVWERQTIEGASIINPNNKQIVSKVTISIGMTEMLDEDDIESMIVRADKALYAAKDNGRNQVVEMGRDELTVVKGEARYEQRTNIAM